MLVWVDDVVLPVEHGGGGFQVFRLTVIAHGLQHGYLIRGQRIRRQGYRPTFDWFCHRPTILEYTERAIEASSVPFTIARPSLKRVSS